MSSQMNVIFIFKLTIKGTRTYLSVMILRCCISYFGKCRNTLIFCNTFLLFCEEIFYSKTNPGSNLWMVSGEIKLTPWTKWLCRRKRSNTYLTHVGRLMREHQKDWKKYLKDWNLQPALWLSAVHQNRGDASRCH